MADHWLPLEELLGHRDVWPPPLGVILHGGKINDVAKVSLASLLSHQVTDEGGELLYGVLPGISDVDRHAVVGGHESGEASHKVRHILKGSSLLPRAVDVDVFALYGSHYEVAHHTSVIQVHAGAVGIEDSRNSNINPILLSIRVCKRLSHSLSLIIASPGSYRVNMSPVCLRLRMHLWVPIHLASGSD